MSMPHWRPLERAQAVFSPTAVLRRAAMLMAVGKTGPAFQRYARAGRTGLAKVAYRVGRCYLDGLGVPRRRAKGIRWLERAARYNHIEAQLQLAVIYLHGTAGESHPISAANWFDVSDIADPDYVKAMQRARKAAEAGSGEAQAVLAFILSSGPQDMRDLEEADLWYERSAAAGCPQGMLGHALALNRKGGETVQREVAVQLGKAAAAGLPAALYLLGVMSERGLGVTRNKSAAAEFYRRAAEKGHCSGQARWGKALMHGIGVDANPSDGETWLRRAALAGDPEAAVALGDFHATGGNLSPNRAEAASWFRRAAEAGHKGAARSLGLLYFAGDGVPHDPEQGMQWLRISAAAGDGPARAELGNLLLIGSIGEEDDRVRIYKGFEQAATSGDLVAAYNCAVCLFHGVGVARDDREAALWLRKAADRVPSAQFWYGRILAEGRGVDRDLKEGRKWIARAADAGIVDAQVALGEMMLTGTGGACDPPGALALFQEAAANGHPAALTMLERHVAAIANQADPDDVHHK